MQRPKLEEVAPNSDQASQHFLNDRSGRPRTNETIRRDSPRMGGLPERQARPATRFSAPVVSHPRVHSPARSMPLVRRPAASSRSVGRPPASGPPAFRSPPEHLHPDLPPPGGHIQETFRDGLAPNRTEGASVLSSAKGSIDITGGTFHAVGGNLVNVHVTLNGSDLPDSIASDSGHVSKKRKTTEVAQVQNTGYIGVARPAASTPHCPQTGDNSSAHLAATTIPVQSINDVYYRCLASKLRGSPLWIPGTNKRLPVKYRRNGLMIGDAGLITDWGFYDSLFNITLPPNDPLAINTDRLPKNFSPLHITPNDIQEYSKFNRDSYLSSASIKNSYQDENPSGLIFESSASEGAILTLPDGSNSEDLGNKKKLLDYLSAHGEEMYRCALIDHGRIFKNGDLRVVTGYDKTTNWGMAAFSNSTAEADSFRLKFRPRDQGSLGRTYSWESSGNAEVKTGPDVRETIALRMGEPSQQEVEYQNQSVFVRTENITLRKDIWNKLLSESGAGNIELDGESDSRSSHLPASAEGSHPSGASGSSSPPTFTPGNYPSGLQSAHSSSTSNTLAVHPSNGINEMLLMLKPSARMAITADEVWISVLTEADSILPPVEHLWKRIMDSFVIQEEDGVVFLEKVATPLTGRQAMASLTSEEWSTFGRLPHLIPSSSRYSPTPQAQSPFEILTEPFICVGDNGGASGDASDLEDELMPILRLAREDQNTKQISVKYTVSPPVEPKSGTSRKVRKHRKLSHIKDAYFTNGFGSRIRDGEGSNTSESNGYGL
ncbi:hypothetical protein GALMADRAFT_804015 [Galerina marginata CBS 339.88]|uniref:Uncharacterized protein n=1 Tax=Galerina marginata (strain CBS 339.88) TaxID=685588 RepID=A0A067SJL2_GALM3|nr:hypothetical protein GALMADRAFT_804015 [Galerina marginata CBS 339.88]